ncbi:MAG: SprB repeat-containing protein, partial [Flavobacteriales bacterium]|nr:SprB repeat-containing protein [Flavobacteriales bacterium]
MLKKLVFFLCGFLFVGFSIQAQTDIAIGSATTSDKNNVINGYYNYSKYQYIYTDDEIGGSGTIDKIRFYVNSYYLGNSTGTIGNVTIRIGHTTTEYFSSSAYLTDPSVIAWTGSWQSTGTGWYEINLTTDFSYNGVDNLLIDIRSQDGTWSNNQIPECRYTDLAGGSTNYKSVKGYSDTSNPPSPLRSKYRANVQLNFSSYIQPLVLTNTTVNEKCISPNSGSVDITVSGGVPPYTYNWSNSATTEDISGLANGVYTLSITDSDSPSSQLVQAYTISKQAEWYYTLGITTDNTINTLTKTVTTSELNSWVSSKNQFTGNGEVSFYVTNPADAFVIGLSENHQIEANYHNIGYSFEQYNGDMWIVAEGSVIGFVTMVTGDQFKIARESNLIKYYKNDIPIAHTDPLPGDSSLYLEASIGTQNASIEEVYINFCIPLEITQATTTNETCGSDGGTINLTIEGGISPYTYVWNNGATTQNISGLSPGTYIVSVADSDSPFTQVTGQYTINRKVEWDYLAGITADPNNNSLTKTANNQNSNSWASSKNQLLGDGEISFTVNNTAKEFIIGLSSSQHTQGNYYAIDYSWEQWNGNMWLVTTGGGNIGFTPMSAGDQFRIKRVGNLIQYFQNDVQYQHTDTLPGDSILYLESSIYHKNAIVSDILVDFCFGMTTNGGTVTNEKCTAGTLGSVQLNTPSDGQSPYIYGWSDGQTAQTA